MSSWATQYLQFCKQKPEWKEISEQKAQILKNKVLCLTEVQKIAYQKTHMHLHGPTGYTGIRTDKSGNNNKMS